MDFFGGSGNWCFVSGMRQPCRWRRYDLPISTIEYTLGSDGFYRYYTNDPSYYNYGFWTIFENPNDDPDVYEIECKKISGANNYGYGMIFGASDENVNLFYSVLIDTTGWYTINKRVPNGTGFRNEPMIPNDEELGRWRSSGNLNDGYNMLNTIKVEVDEYSIYFNDSAIANYSFTDEEPYGNRIGFYTSVSSEENEDFPNTPVDTRFRAK